ncbi:hypothetical protein [Clostridium formicaceticum]|uniref:Uncharacterized protein n=1 Tax=Clostridium formicaceticum TaxID=1497 RepID=A0AAC9RJE4_9CLOT|nr:hypothetical protein [Clostridium formicaceticum]AOY76016.1 hypothetical protein BJL90_08960 [Clostridium formicaceticum]ARE86373.1 hypothetical protein CLFO_06950 [Clostridium formicaceticum]
MKNKYKPILILICIINLFLLTAFGQNITKAIGKQSTVTESVYNQEKPKLPIGKNQHLTVTQSVYGIHEETILHLITTVDKFSSLTEEEQLLILTYYQVEQETMILLEEKGFGLLESIEIVVLVKELDFTIEQATRLITKYPKNQEIELVKLLQGFKTFFEEEQSTEEKFQNIKDLFTKGYGVGEIRNAYIMSETVDANPSELVEDIENRKSDIDKKLLFYTIIEDCNEIEMYLVEEMQRWYPVDLEKLVENKEKKNLTWQEIYEKFEQEKKQRIKPAETILSSTNLEGSLNPNEEGNHIQSMMTTFSTDSRGQQYYPKYINPAYNYRQYNNEFINTSTGSVEFETQLFKLPGRNGLDVNINLNYNSNTASIYEMNQYISI